MFEKYKKIKYPDFQAMTVNTFDDYEKALKNTLLNKSVIESPDNKFLDVTLKDGSKGLMYSPCTLMNYASIYGKA